MEEVTNKVNTITPTKNINNVIIYISFKNFNLELNLGNNNNIGFT